MKTTTILFLTGLFTVSSYALEKRDILQNEANNIGIEQVLVMSFNEMELPTYHDREFWNNLPSHLTNQYIQDAEAFLKYDWPVVKATDYLEVIRTGDRRQEAYSAPRKALVSLVMGELVEGKGHFIDQIVNGVWYYSEQTWWGWSAHLGLQKAPHGLPDDNEPTIDLGVGEISNILSWTWFLFKDEFDKIHPLIATRLKNEIMKKAIIPYYHRTDFWWMGLDTNRKVNNWNPWTNHNILSSILILEDDSIKKINGVRKVIRSLDVFINGYPDDGGCDEGPSYWGRAGASLYQCLDLLKLVTNGKFDVYHHQIVKNMGSYIYKTYIHSPYFINFADADPKTGSRPDIIYRFGKDIEDPVMQNFGAYLASENNWGNNPFYQKIDEQIFQLLFLDEILNAKAEEPLIRDFWLSDTKIAGARDRQGSFEGFFFAAKGGYNQESHNHNDAGSSVLYYNGTPCLVDIGREKYVAKTFSSRRYEIWTMQSQYHNLPKINGYDQAPGEKFRAKNTAFTANSKKAVFTTDISGAYPDSAYVKKWIRSYILDRGRRFNIVDNYELAKILEGPTTLNFVTSCKVSEIAPGKLQLKGEGFALNMNYHAKTFIPKIELNEVTDSKLKTYWPGGITRIVLTIKDPGISGKHQVYLTPVKL